MGEIDCCVLNMVVQSPNAVTIMITKRIRFSAKVVAFLILSCATVFGQEPSTNKVYRDVVIPHWFAGTNRFWYRVNVAANEREFILVDAVVGKREPAFDHARLAKALSEKTGKTIEAHKLPFDNIRFADDLKSVRLIASNTVWQCSLDSYELTESSPQESDRATEQFARGRGRRGGFGQRGGGTTNLIRGARSPDGKWEAIVHGHNLFLRDVRTEKETQLTYDANPNSTYQRSEEITRSVEMSFNAADPEAPTPDVQWAPDSKHLVAMRLKPGTQRRVYLVASSPEDQLQPKLDSYPYLKPGDEVPVRKPHLFDVEAKKEIPVDDALFSNPWSLNELRWNPDSSRFTFQYNQRGHQVLRIVAVDAQSGVAKAIVDEQSKTFIDYSGKSFNEILDNSGEIVWMSERDGWNHLYLYDAKTGAVKNQITKGQWVVRAVDRVDQDKRQIWFRASGIRPQDDPYFVHECRVNFDGGDLKILTEGNGTHVAQFSPDNRFFIDSWSRVDFPPVTELRSSDDGKLVCKLEEADAHELFATGWKPPEPFVAKGRDGVTDIYGAIWRPKDFDPKKKYPVIENIYAGPHDSFTPKNFRATYQHQKLADRGFIVVQMDGFGTCNRSKIFHDYCWKNLADAGFPDRILWIKAAAAKYPYMDLQRVGIYGTSAGGQDSLRGMLDHGDFYKVCVSDCGCHDNRMDKIWWNEQWMGWPVDESYVKSSNVVDAHKLQGKLLLMVGETDHNVDPSSTMQVVNALIKADKDFELLVMPGADHGVARTPYGAKRLEEFFVKNFLGTQTVPDVSRASN
jgi:dipeptidyl-peptidase-4